MRTSSQTSEGHSGSKWIRCDILKTFAFFKYSFQRFKQIEERLEYLSKDNRSVSIKCSVESDQVVTSPNSIKTLPSNQLMRLEEMVSYKVLNDKEPNSRTKVM